ncbi:hypothetical protein ABMA28_016016 [Loxostege sticticalis]|uniref:Carboxylic ester hydrolase n=1 Tax=Loxostege sticticalis TaxID=481309 RepID=A0ABD0T7K4_LOXSC
MQGSNEVKLLLLLFSRQLLCCPIEAEPMVYAPAGPIRGLKATDGNYSMFLGIPYAKVDPDNPFGPSKPAPKFINTFEANDDSVICPQFNVYSEKIEGMLDCLHLSVFVPNSANPHNKLPVMVKIPGGAFVRGVEGRYQYGPKFLVRHDVILVYINHRLGPYGFLCLDLPAVPGNQGLKDQVMAFKWIKDNIESFGGDTDQITIFGYSSGSKSIDFHLIYTNGKLFKQAILQSGSSLEIVVEKPDKYAPLKITKYLGMSTNSTTEALAFLANIDPKIVIETVRKLKLEFEPCIEKVFDGVEPFITEAWVNVKKPLVKGRNIMLGIDEYEEVITYVYTYKSINESLLHFFNFSNKTLIEMSELVSRFYMGDQKNVEDIKMPMINFYSDFLVVHPMQRRLKQYLGGEAENIYYYMFSYSGKRNNGQIKFRFTFDGAVHGDEIGYLFDPEFLTEKPTPEDQLIIDRVTALWTNFAKYGNPTPEKTELLPVIWAPVSDDQQHYLKIDLNLTMKNSLFHERMAFWDFFYILNKKYQKGYVDIE